MRVDQDRLMAIWRKCRKEIADGKLDVAKFVWRGHWVDGRVRIVPCGVV